MKIIFTLILLMSNFLAAPAFAGSYELGMEFYNNRNFSNALYMLDMASQQNDERAYQLTGILYYKKGDYNNALKYLLKDEENFDKPSKDPKNPVKGYETYTYLGLLYQYGMPDYQKAMDWYFKIPKESLTSDNKYHIGMMLMLGSDTLTQNTASGLIWLKEATSNNFGQSLFDLGMAYEKGEGTLKDKEMAKYYYNQALKESELNNEKVRINASNQLAGLNKVVVETPDPQDKVVEQMALNGLKITETKPIVKKEKKSDEVKEIRPPNDLSTNITMIVIVMVIIFIISVICIKIFFKKMRVKNMLAEEPTEELTEA